MLIDIILFSGPYNIIQTMQENSIVMNGQVDSLQDASMLNEKLMPLLGAEQRKHQFAVRPPPPLSLLLRFPSHLSFVVSLPVI